MIDSLKWSNSAEAQTFARAAQNFASMMGASALFSRKGRYLGCDDQIVTAALEMYCEVTGREFGDHPPLLGRDDWRRAIKRVVR